MTSTKIRKMFSGNNTGQGFYSFYYDLINFSTTQVFILKGGPGTGKSTLMKKIGGEMLRQGYEVEYHYCASDNASLDGLVIPVLRIAIVDGTEPHVIDPQNFGVRETIVNLGDLGEEKILLQNKEKIIELNQRKKWMFQLAYSYLREAKVIQEELAGCYQKAVDSVGINQLFYEIVHNVFRDVRAQFVKRPTVRNLFASANTPDGYVTHLDSILQAAQNVYFFTGILNRGKENFLEAIYRWGTSRGLDCELYHCPLDPSKYELVYFPGLLLGFLRCNDFLVFEPSLLPELKNCREINFDQYLDIKIMKFYKPEIREAKKRLVFLQKKAWEKLKLAQKFHNQLEELYFPAIDFALVDEKREKLLKRILAEPRLTKKT